MKGYKELVELLKHTQATGGLDIDEKSICEYQDMIAHSNEDQLKELANGNYKESFYRVYGYAYGTVEAIRFHCKHGAKIREILEENEELKADRNDWKKKAETAHETAEKYRELWAELHGKSVEQETRQERRIAELETENIKLKAKLYDMMTAGQ